MPLELIEDAVGDSRNAVALARASDLAYCPADEGARRFLSELSLESRLISVSNTQVYVGGNDDHIVVAFRGSEAPTSIDGLKDWLLTNANNLLILPEGQLGTDFVAAGVGCRFHRGFMNAIADIWDPFLEAVKGEVKKKDRPVWVTGHSLGGALALLAAWRLQRQFVSVHQAYTFGGPMVGNKETSLAFDREFPDKIFRYINRPDVVPWLPTISLVANAYQHCHKEMGLGEASAAVSSAVDLLKGLVGRTVDGVLHATLIDDLWNLVKERIGAHDITQYAKLITGAGSGAG